MGPCATSVSEYAELQFLDATKDGRPAALPAPLSAHEQLSSGPLAKLLLAGHIASASLQKMGTLTKEIEELTARTRLGTCGPVPYAPMLPGIYETHPVLVAGEIVSDDFSARIVIPDDRQVVTLVVAGVSARYRVTCMHFEGINCPAEVPPPPPPLPVQPKSRGCAIASESASPWPWLLVGSLSWLRQRSHRLRRVLNVVCLWRAGRRRRG